MATSRFPLLLLLSLSWIAAAFAGAMGAVGLQHWRGSQPIVTTSLRIVDDLIRAQYEVERILNGGLHEVSVVRLQQLAERERSEAPPGGFVTPAS